MPSDDDYVSTLSGRKYVHSHYDTGHLLCMNIANYIIYLSMVLLNPVNPEKGIIPIRTHEIFKNNIELNNPGKELKIKIKIIFFTFATRLKIRNKKTYFSDVIKQA